MEHSWLITPVDVKTNGGLGFELLVGPPIFLDNRSKDLHETWHDCRDRYSKKTDESFFVKKFVP